jgi:hypothetical protein
MNPALILIIVNKERSVVDSVDFSTALGSTLNGAGHAIANSVEHHPATIGHLVFQAKPHCSVEINGLPVSSQG